MDGRNLTGHPARIASLRIATMPCCASTSAVVSRAVDILSAAGFNVHPMHGPKRIDRDKYEATVSELSGKEQREDLGPAEAVSITGFHEDHGRTELRREAGVFTIRAEDLSFVQP